MWRATVFTLFPEMFPGPLGISLWGEALSRGLWSIEIRDIRAHGQGRHRAVDDTPAGGGPGMVIRADVLATSLDAGLDEGDRRPRLLPAPRGAPFTQARAHSLADGEGAVLICGRFEGVDERAIAARGLEEISIGDYVLSGGGVGAVARRDGSATFGCRREFRGGASRISALYAAARMGGKGNPGRAAFRRPRENQGLARGRGAQAHAREKAGF